MPLVVLAGQPASGKSTVAAQLVELLQQAGTVELVDEPSLHLERNAAYASESHGCNPGRRLTRPVSVWLPTFLICFAHIDLHTHTHTQKHTHTHNGCRAPINAKQWSRCEST